MKITDEWRRALDKKYVIGVVSVGFRKAVDAIPTPFYYENFRVLV